MYRCNCCGEIFDEPHLHMVKEDRGEYWGMPAYETVCFAECPHCGEVDFEEGHLFEIAGTWVVQDDYEHFFRKGNFDEEVFAANEDEAEEVLYERLQNVVYDKFRSPDVFYTIDYIEEV